MNHYVNTMINIYICYLPQTYEDSQAGGEGYLQVPVLWDALQYPQHSGETHEEMLGSQQSLLSRGRGRDHPLRQSAGQQVHHLRLTQLHEVHHGHQEGNRIDVVKFAFS